MYCDYFKMYFHCLNLEGGGREHANCKMYSVQCSLQYLGFKLSNYAARDARVIQKKGQPLEINISDLTTILHTASGFGVIFFFGNCSVSFITFFVLKINF